MVWAERWTVEEIAEGRRREEKRRRKHYDSLVRRLWWWIRGLFKR